MDEDNRDTEEIPTIPTPQSPSNGPSKFLLTWLFDGEVFVEEWNQHAIVLLKPAIIAVLGLTVVIFAPWAMLAILAVIALVYASKKGKNWKTNHDKWEKASLLSKAKVWKKPDHQVSWVTIHDQDRNFLVRLCLFLISVGLLALIIAVLTHYLPMILWSVVAFVPVAAYIGYVLLLRRYWRFGLTGDRLIRVTGLGWPEARIVGMMPLGRITDMSYKQSIFGRMFGYATFTIETAGDDQTLRETRYLPDPDRIYKLMLEVSGKNLPLTARKVRKPRLTGRG